MKKSSHFLVTMPALTLLFVIVTWSQACAYSDAVRRNSDAQTAEIRVAEKNAVEVRDLAATGAPIQPAPVDPAIQKALAAITTERMQHTVEKLVSFGNRSTLSSMDTDLKPGTGVNAAADWIVAELQSYSRECDGCLEVKRDTFTEAAGTGPNARIVKPTVITNIYAVLRGSDPVQARRMYLVTGHYDSRNSTNADTHNPAPGANDDASGVAVSLECARVLSKIKFPATLVFAVVAGEEQGLNGSLHLARFAKSEGWQLEGVLNNDIVGGNTTPGDTLQDKHLVRVFSEGVSATMTPEQLHVIQTLGGENDSPSRQLARAVGDAARTYFAAHTAAKTAAHAAVPAKTGTCPQGCFEQVSFTPVMEFRPDRFLRGGDHSSFNQQGFAAVRLTEWREDYHHQHQDVRMENGVQYGDLIQFVDFRYVANVATLNAATLATLASAPAPPRNVKIAVRELTNETELHWDADPAAHFEVVWRETSAPIWQYALPVTGNSGKLSVSKDNVIFGVRAVDSAGHRSLAVVPTPER